MEKPYDQTMPPGKYTLEQHLHSYSDDENYGALWKSWDSDKREYTQRLALIPMTFKSYSCHDASHSEQIILNIERLLGPDRIRKLSLTDTWLLLQCAYTHDLGMCVNEREKADMLKKSDVKAMMDSGEMREWLEEIHSWSKANGLTQQARQALRFWEKRAEEESWDEFRDSFGRHFSQAQYFYDQLVQEYFRGFHAQRSADKVNQEAQNHTAYIFPIRLRTVVADVIRCHGLDFSSVLALNSEEDGLHADTIHPRFAAAMLRIGDLLDIDSNRFNTFQMESLERISPVSAQYFFCNAMVRHRSVTPEHISLVIHYNWREIAEYLNTHEVNQDANELLVRSVQVSRGWLKWIEEESRNIRLCWEDLYPGGFAGSFARANEGDLLVLVDGQSTKPGDLDMKYEISPSRASHIIEGSGLYNEPLAFLREVIQNAVDATKRQLHIDMKPQWDRRLSCENPPLTWNELREQPAYPAFLELPAFLEEEAQRLENATVEVIFSMHGDKELSIRAIDHGIGITKERIVHMQRVGDILPLEGFRHMLSWMKPTGDFGIGMQSIFLVTDRFEIQTRPWEKENGKDMQRRIQFNSTRLGGDIFNYEEDIEEVKRQKEEEYAPGTTVTIRVDLTRASKFLMSFLPKTVADLRIGKDLRLNFPLVFMQEVKDYIQKHFIGELVPIRLNFTEGFAQNTIELHAPLHTPSYLASQASAWKRVHDNSRLYYIRERPDEDESLFFWHFVKRPKKSEKSFSHNLFVALRLRRLRAGISAGTRLFYRGILFRDSSGDRTDHSDETTMEEMIRIPGFQCDLNLMYGAAREIIEINREHIKRERYADLWRELRECLQAFIVEIEDERGRLLRRERWTEGKAAACAQEERLRLLEDILFSWHTRRGATQGIVIDRKEKIILFDADITFTPDVRASLYLADLGIADTYKQRLELNEPDVDKQGYAVPNPKKLQRTTELPRLLFAEENTHSEIKQNRYSEVLAFDVRSEDAEAFRVFRFAERTDEYESIACDRNLPQIDDYSYSLLVRDIIRRRKQNETEGNYYPVFPARRADLHSGCESLIVCSVPIGTSAYEVDRYSHWIISPYPLSELSGDIPFFSSKKEFWDEAIYPGFSSLRQFIHANASVQLVENGKLENNAVKKAYEAWLYSFMPMLNRLAAFLYDYLHEHEYLLENISDRALRTNLCDLARTVEECFDIKISQKVLMEFRTALQTELGVYSLELPDLVQAIAKRFDIGSVISEKELSALQVVQDLATYLERQMQNR